MGWQMDIWRGWVKLQGWGALMHGKPAHWDTSQGQKQSNRNMAMCTVQRTGSSSQSMLGNVRRVGQRAHRLVLRSTIPSYSAIGNLLTASQDQKLEMASKTKVLVLSDMGLKSVPGGGVLGAQARTAEMS